MAGKSRQTHGGRGGGGGAERSKEREVFYTLCPALLTDLSLVLHRDTFWLMLTSASYCICQYSAGDSGKMQRAGDRGCGAD